jgi:hypothetical protein
MREHGENKNSINHTHLKPFRIKSAIDAIDSVCLFFIVLNWAMQLQDLAQSIRDLGQH